MSAYFQSENPFNIQARWIANLPGINQELYQSKDNRDVLADTDDWDNKADKLFSSLPEFDDVDALLRNGVSREAEGRLETWREKNSGFAPNLALVCGLDRRLDWNHILQSTYLRVYLKDGFQSLNDNWDETGICVLPRVPSLNDPLDRAGASPAHKTWAHAWERGVNEELTNTYYVEQNWLDMEHNSYTVIHKVVTDWVTTNPIRVAVSPVSSGVQLQAPHCYETDGRRRFSITGLNDPDYVRRRVRASYKMAAELGANILAYPEMLGDASMFGPTEAGSDFFAQLSEEVGRMGYSAPGLLLPPTYWHEKNNRLYVTGGDGRRLCVQDKQNPFLYHDSATCKDYLEDLEGKTKVICVIHIPYAGRLTFPICKDCLVEPYRTLLVRALRSTMLLCSSYSKGSFSFRISAPASLEYGCYTLWTNTCSARPECGAPPDYVGLIAAPNAEMVYPFQPRCQGRCGGPDDVCLFLAEIRRTGGAPEVTMREHIHPNQKT